MGSSGVTLKSVWLVALQAEVHGRHHRADEGRPLLAEVLAMYIAPEEHVHGEVRRRQPDRNIFGQVLAMLHLRVDDDGSAVIAGLDAGGFGSLDDLLDRCHRRWRGRKSAALPCAMC